MLKLPALLHGADPSNLTAVQLQLPFNASANTTAGALVRLSGQLIRKGSSALREVPSPTSLKQQLLKAANETARPAVIKNVLFKAAAEAPGAIKTSLARAASDNPGSLKMQLISGSGVLKSQLAKLANGTAAGAGVLKAQVMKVRRRVAGQCGCWAPVTIAHCCLLHI
jgi:hypothetical protein